MQDDLLDTTSSFPFSTEGTLSVEIIGCYVTKFVPHKVLKSNAYGSVDETIGFLRVAGRHVGHNLVLPLLDGGQPSTLNLKP